MFWSPHAFHFCAPWVLWKKLKKKQKSPTWLLFSLSEVSEVRKSRKIQCTWVASARQQLTIKKRRLWNILCMKWLDQSNCHIFKLFNWARSRSKAAYMHPVRTLTVLYVSIFLKRLHYIFVLQLFLVFFCVYDTTYQKSCSKQGCSKLSKISKRFLLANHYKGRRG